VRFIYKKYGMEDKRNALRILLAEALETIWKRHAPSVNDDI
jgi:hypothetical protein